MRSLRLFIAVGVLATAGLTGCGVGTVAVPSLAESAAAVAGPPLQISVYGGHAPLAGAHVFILQPNLAANYGASVSIATYVNGSSPSGGGAVLTNDPTHVDGNGNSSYYATTDNNGNVSINNDYVCTPGVPVYLAATGGATFFAGAVYTFALNQAVTITGSGATQTATFTIDASRTAYPGYELFFPGETVTLGGSSTPPNAAVPPSGANIVALGGALASLNGTTAVVQAAGLTSTSFTVAITSSIAAGSYTLPPSPGPPTTPTISPAATVTGIAPAAANSNPAVINMAYLGTCPASGAANFGSTSIAPLSNIYMNEVSTTALAYATAAFGSDPFHIGAVTTNATTMPSGLTRGQYVKMGLLEAFNNANVLYDITGGNVSTSFAGEGHIARAVTPSGNGLVPTAKIDYIGNILASCVDSPNTASVKSAACANLFANTSNTGLACTVGAAPAFAITCPGGTTAPTETGTAVFNLAHFPAGTAVGPTTNNASTIAALYGLPTANVPFTPNAFPVNGNGQFDWTIEIEWTVPPAAVTNGGLSTSLLNGPNDIAIDGGVQQSDGTFSQSAWIGSDYANATKIFLNGGTPDYTANTSLRVANGTTGGVCGNSNNFTCQTNEIAIDPANNVYVLSQAAGNNITKWTGAGAFTGVFNNYNGAGFNFANSLVLNSGNNLLITNSGAGTVVKLPSGFTNATVPTILSAANAPCTGTYTAGTSAGPANIVLDRTNTYAYVYNSSTAMVCVIDASTGALVATGGGFSNTSGTIAAYGALTATNAYVQGSDATGFNHLQTATTAGNGPAYLDFTGTKNPGGLSFGSSTAVDGAGSIWSGNSNTWGLAALDSAGNWLSPNAGFAFGYSNTGRGNYFGPGAAPNPYPAGNFSTTNGGFPAIDAAGNIWVAYRGASNPGPQVIYELIGVAAPTWQPLSFQVNSSLAGTRPQ